MNWTDSEFKVVKIQEVGGGGGRLDYKSSDRGFFVYKLYF